LLPGHFIGYAVGNRQRALLAAASLVLKEVSGGQFGFSNDFRIVDNETGQSRAPQTLSGGEQFLASLSLALGLVEVTARSGGRLDALFLDEGFGSLDPNTLQQALTALERRAEAGRLVALISHVPQLAEQIERVLHVTKNHQGSDARILTAAERGEIAFADVAESGL
jgi:exonuclease SbcC